MKIKGPTNKQKIMLHHFLRRPIPIKRNYCNKSQRTGFDDILTLLALTGVAGGGVLLCVFVSDELEFQNRKRKEKEKRIGGCAMSDWKNEDNIKLTTQIGKN